MAGGTQQERKKLRDLLKRLREDSGLRQIDVASMLGKPQSYVSKYESGEKTLDFLEIKSLCEVVGISFTDFIKEHEGVTFET